MLKIQCIFSEHVWNNWQYIFNDNCIMIRLCDRCGIMDNYKKTEHIWDQWQFNDDTECNAYRKCNRCKQVEEKEFHELEFINNSVREIGSEIIDGCPGWTTYKIYDLHTTEYKCIKCNKIITESNVTTRIIAYPG